MHVLGSVVSSRIPADDLQRDLTDVLPEGEMGVCFSTLLNRFGPECCSMLVLEVNAVRLQV